MVHAIRYTQVDVLDIYTGKGSTWHGRSVGRDAHLL